MSLRKWLRCVKLSGPRRNRGMRAVVVIERQSLSSKNTAARLSKIGSMSHGIFRLRPTRLDLAIADCCELSATPTNQRIARVVTLLADEKAVLALAGTVWFASRLV